VAYAYITSADINNKIFNRNPVDVRQVYIDQANVEIEDLAIRKGIAVEDISTPIHVKIQRYGVQYALSIFAEDRIGFNNSEAEMGGEDVYDSLFKRTRYILQNVKQDITPVMFTSATETPINRAVCSQVIVRG
jgi:hypothetical protein